jgi:hypothetical protein
VCGWMENLLQKSLDVRRPALIQPEVGSLSMA